VGNKPAPESLEARVSSDVVCKGSYFLGSNCGHCERCQQERREILLKVQESRRLLQAASPALKSYAFGNAAPGLAFEIAEAIDLFLETGRLQTLAGKGKP
jgi:hypothetical protein